MTCPSKKRTRDDLFRSLDIEEQLERAEEELQLAQDELEAYEKRCTELEQQRDDATQKIARAAGSVVAKTPVLQLVYVLQCCNELSVRIRYIPLTGTDPVKNKLVEQLAASEHWNWSSDSEYDEEGPLPDDLKVFCDLAADKKGPVGDWFDEFDPKLHELSKVVTVMQPED